MSETIFLTGGTGFLGTELAARLVRIPNVTVYVLVRCADKGQLCHRLRASWQHEPELVRSIGTRVIPVAGDFTSEGLGLGEEDAAVLQRSVTLVIHAGAEISFRKSRRELEETNVAGTKHMLSFARNMPLLRRFVYLSTAYVAGQRRGTVTEADMGTEFSSHYEASKAKAEALVRASGLPFAVCRPGMIVGDSETGWVRSFNTVYYVLKRLLLGRLRVLPIAPEMPLNLVPVDYVADAVIRIALSPESGGKTFHITCPTASAPRAGELTEYVRAWAKVNLGTELPKPVFAPLSLLKGVGVGYNRRENPGQKSELSNLLTLMPYFFGEQVFERSNTDSICGTSCPHWHDYIHPLLSFACRKNFMRQRGDTVFQQAQVRRESKSYPVCYYDVTPQGIQRVTGGEANRRIQRILGALWAWGIRKGDRVALTGINCVDYMTLEQAIGLLGAVSVPIYYTAPAKEVSLLLQRRRTNFAIHFSG